MDRGETVSYTHLDVYKRQLLGMAGLLPAAHLYEYDREVYTVTGTEPVQRPEYIQ